MYVYTYRLLPITNNTCALLCYDACRDPLHVVLRCGYQELPESVYLLCGGLPTAGRLFKHFPCLLQAMSHRQQTHSSSLCAV